MSGSPQQGVLLCGCGGGYDVLGCLPLFFRLRKQGSAPVMVNLTFTKRTTLLEIDHCERITNQLWRVDPPPQLPATPSPAVGSEQEADGGCDRARARCTEKPVVASLPASAPPPMTPPQFEYFPEYTVSRLLGEPVYLLFCDGTIQDMVKAYEYIFRAHNAHMAYLIDGGCDVLLSGNECQLGTPVEDMMHLKALRHFVCDCGKVWRSGSSPPLPGR